MPQEQHVIEVRFRDGTVDPCVRTGNNAAWHCCCDRDLPLVGYSDQLESENDYSAVECPDCARRYRVVAPGLKKVPLHVQEIG